jgi:phasin family protein
MATNGPKPTGKPAARKPVARASKPAAPEALAAAFTEENPVPAILAATDGPAPIVEPAQAVGAASQEVVHTIEAAAAPAQAAVAETVNEAEAAMQAAADSIAKEAVTMDTNFQNSADINTNKAQAFFADMNDRTKGVVERSTKLVEEANDFAKGNVEALVESSRIAAKGLETLGQDAAEYGRKSFESATAAMKTLATVKSPAEFFKLHNDYVRGVFDSYVAEASKNTEAMMKLAGDAAQPLSNRFAVAAEKVKTAA